MSVSYLEIENAEIHAQTDKAALILFRKEEKAHWVPWSCIEDNGEDFKNGYKGKIYIAKWYCDSRGIEGKE